jgi:putative ABC transport system permease protein
VAATLLVLLGTMTVFSHVLQLGILTQLVTAASRTVLQLSALGFVLVPIFRRDAPGVVLLCICFMLCIAAYEAQKRPAWRYAGMWQHIVAALCCCTAITITSGFCGVLHTGLRAQYAIPLAGMLGGNVLTAASLALSSLLQQLAEQPQRIEMLLALGATRTEALRQKGGVISRAVSVAITPTVQRLAVLGIVSIPGMLSGQVLAGSSPVIAARYQIIIMFLISFNAVLGVSVLVHLASRRVLDATHRLRRDLLTRRQP